jgi:excisionase family DNA binding protein
MSDVNLPQTLLTETEVSKQLRVSLAALRKWRVMKKGPQFLKVGSLVRYRQADVDQWLASLPVGGGLHETNEDAGNLRHNGEPQAPVGAGAGTVRLLPARARG